MFKFCEQLVSRSISLARRPRRLPGHGAASMASVAFKQQSTDDFLPQEADIPVKTKRTNPVLTNEVIRAKRNHLFTKEKVRQRESVRRVEKIEVVHRGIPEDCTLVMNKHLSTPFDCALHLSQTISTRSALALVNGKPWDMHRPLDENCDVQFMHFMEENPAEANLAFWRTGSLLLSYVADRAFRYCEDESQMTLLLSGIVLV